MSKLLSVHKEDAAFSVPKLGKMRSSGSDLLRRMNSLKGRQLSPRRATVLHPPLRR